MIYSSAKLLFVVEEQTGQTLGSKVTVLLDHSCLNIVLMVNEDSKDYKNLKPLSPNMF